MEHFFAGQFVENAGKLIVFVAMLSLLVVFHEAGHFLLARLHGVRVNDFAVGFGPTLLKWTSPRSGTNYRINALLLGGYCAMQGEDGKTSEAAQQREFRAHHTALSSDDFQSKGAWQRLSIVLAGPVANFLLTFLILFVGAMTFGIQTDKFGTVIGPLSTGSAGMKAGLHTGDRVTAIDGTAVKNGEVFVTMIRNSPGVPLDLTVDRQGTTMHFKVTPTPKLDEHGKKFGLIGFHRVPELHRVGPAEAFREAASGFQLYLMGNVQRLSALIAHPKQYFGQATSIVGMERQAATIQDLGWGPYLDVAAAISMALGVFNLLPFPALDGGRAVFILAELLRGRPLDREKEALVHVAGFALLMVLMVAVVYKDVANIVAGKGVF
jgi:regulator of sigma E protease